MSISDLVDLGLEVATAQDAPDVAVFAFAGSMALGFGAMGAVMSDKEERATQALEAAGLQVMGLRVLESGEIQVIVDARDLGRGSEADRQAREREKRAYQVLVCSGLAPVEQPADAATVPYVTAMRSKNAKSVSLFERLPPLLNFL